MSGLTAKLEVHLGGGQKCNSFMQLLDNKEKNSRAQQT